MKKMSAVLLLCVIVFVTASLESCKKIDKPVETQNAVAENKTVTEQPAAETMEQMLLSLNEINISFRGDQPEPSDSDAVGDIVLAGNPGQKGFACEYPLSNAVSELEKVNYTDSNVVFVIKLSNCVNGDDDGCEEKKSFLFNCPVDKKTILEQKPSGRLMLKQAKCDLVK